MKFLAGLRRVRQSKLQLPDCHGLIFLHDMGTPSLVSTPHEEKCASNAASKAFSNVATASNESKLMTRPLLDRISCNSAGPICDVRAILTSRGRVFPSIVSAAWESPGVYLTCIPLLLYSSTRMMSSPPSAQHSSTTTRPLALCTSSIVPETTSTQPVRFAALKPLNCVFKEYSHDTPISIPACILFTTAN